MSPMSSALLLSTFFFSIIPRPPISTLFPYTTLFRSATLQIVDNTSESATNPIDVSRTFAGQHYHDFLYRQSDLSGEDFWTNQIEQCGADVQCRQVKRVNVSGAFFLSIEFKETGYLLIRAHK